MITTLLCSMLFATQLNVHDTAPNFEALDCDAHTQSLSRLLAQGPVILVFFPKAFTSGCTQELKSFAKSFDTIKKRGAVLIAISSDRAETLRKFKAELEADFTFIPDPEGRIMNLYQVKTPLVTFAKRTTFVIDRKGQIARIDEGSAAVKAQNALNALDTLGIGGL